ncbi:MAG: biotin transporter BioY [Lachnospiraceae bacterium]|nr:biotin transporter BioY [Lachnospiraceae bacterium]
MKVQEMVYCGIFTTLIAAGAFIKIPIPVVPFTLQFLFTMLAGLLLGGRLGALCVAVYILLGLAGLPIFAEGGGLWYIVKPSFGYLIGFCLGSYVTGKMVEKHQKTTLTRYFIANFTGLFIVYAIGMIYYYVISNFVIHTPIGLWPLFLYCFILAVPGDICLCILAAFLARRLRTILM